MNSKIVFLIVYVTLFLAFSRGSAVFSAEPSLELRNQYTVGAVERLIDAMNSVDGNAALRKQFSDQTQLVKTFILKSDPSLVADLVEEARASLDKQGRLAVLYGLSFCGKSKKPLDAVLAMTDDTDPNVALSAAELLPTEEKYITRKLRAYVFSLQSNAAFPIGDPPVPVFLRGKVAIKRLDATDNVNRALIEAAPKAKTREFYHFVDALRSRITKSRLLKTDFAKFNAQDTEELDQWWNDVGKRMPKASVKRQSSPQK